MRRHLLPILILGLSACGDDPGFPWPDEAPHSAAVWAAGNAHYDLVRIEIAVVDTNPIDGVPVGCGTRSGALTAGGSAKDTDADGIPDDLTITITQANCDTMAFGWLGKIHVSDPGATPGYDYAADLTDTLSFKTLVRQADVRHIRWNGATTTGSIDYQEWYTGFTVAGPQSEVARYTATFTLTPSGGPTLAMGTFGPATLDFTGWVSWNDELLPASAPWRFAVRVVSPIGLDPGCGDTGGVFAGAYEGRLNGSGPATFTQTWSACDVSVVSTEGTTD